MNVEQIKEIFQSYPEAKTLYMDPRGNIWTSKPTAKQQSKGGDVKTLKRSEFTNKIKV